MIQQEEIKNTLIEELGLSSLSEGNKDLVISKFGESLLKRITAVTLGNLPEEARGEFNTLSKEGNNDKMHNFLQAKIPGIEELIQNEIKEGIAEFRNIVTGLK
ncbi:MAG: DUF5663 domain-containing protein [Parcubacteria group bacterium]|nr:DUF5663 domain-containing protein [Parcubacteria group bacterium]MCR4342809.1 DUF5663 domain-containing protein [Patescibacteria group bacterium]